MRSSLRKPIAPLVALVLVAVALFGASPAAAAKKQMAERFLRPDFASFQVRSIAVLPVATLMPVTVRGRENDPMEIMGIHEERALGPIGYRFLSGNLFRSSAKAAGEDSAVAQLAGGWQARGELDSTALKAIGAAGIADAVLAAMVTIWERTTIDPSVAGQSMTQIGVRMALYSTRTGELLWRDTFLEKGEGPYNNPGESNVTGMSRTGLTPSAQTSTALDPPTFDDVAVKLEKKVRSGFPPVPKAPAATP